jgi:hypothetical protein
MASAAPAYRASCRSVALIGVGRKLFSLRSALVYADDAKAVVVGKVVEILYIKGYEREVADQAACRDPSVVHRPGAAPPLGIGSPTVTNEMHQV